ncbi:MAG: cell division protein ZapD [Gammaproteobacteria bacterium]|nr:cell division protein ZapD [Gammaproteobacteria bacterium]
MRSTVEIQDAIAEHESVTYEQPLNERLRTFLRLNFLFQQAAHHAEGASPWSGRATVASLLEILAILGRGDIRQEITKEIERLSTNFRRFAAQPGVDTSRLDALLGDLDQLRTALDSANIGASSTLRESIFLNAIKHRSVIPGGTCEFDLPDYKHWLGLPFDVRSRDVSTWMKALTPLKEGVDRVLWLLRETNPPTEEIAHAGMYQHVLSRGVSCQMIRVTLPPHTELYPEISGSAHRFTVRFYHFQNVDDRPAQTTEDVSFQLTCCG